MKTRVIVTIVALVVALGAGGGLAYAQQATAQIDFAFVANGKELPAGKYLIDAPSNGPVSIKGMATGAAAIFLTPITKLGRHDTDKDPELVFDKVGGKLLLSEIWLPGADGILVLATKGPHEHAVAGGPTARK